MKDNLSPEEKLLKLIKGDKKPKTETPPVSKKEKGDVSIFHSPKNYRKIEPSPFLKPSPFLTSHLLIILAFISVAFLTTAFMYPLFNSGRVELPDAGKEELSLAGAQMRAEVKPLESYLEGLKSRQIFAASSLPEGALPTSAPVTNTLDLFKDISLVGIISSSPPQAVIEDKKTQKTYYLSKGQSMGDLKVDDIQEGKVVLNYLGTKYELYM